MKPIFICILSRLTAPQHVKIINEQLRRGTLAEEYHILCVRDSAYEGPMKFQCLSSDGTILPAEFEMYSALNFMNPIEPLDESSYPGP